MKVLIRGDMGAQVIAVKRSKQRKRVNGDIAVPIIAVPSVLLMAFGGLYLEQTGGRTAPGVLDPGQRLAQQLGPDTVNQLLDLAGNDQPPTEGQFPDTTFVIGDTQVTAAEWACASRARLTAAERQLVDAAALEYPGGREVRRRWELDDQARQTHVYTVQLSPDDLTGFDAEEATDSPEPPATARETANRAARTVFSGATFEYRAVGGPGDTWRSTVRMPPGRRC